MPALMVLPATRLFGKAILELVPLKPADVAGVPARAPGWPSVTFVSAASYAPALTATWSTAFGHRTSGRRGDPAAAPCEGDRQLTVGGRSADVGGVVDDRCG